MVLVIGHLKVLYSLYDFLNNQKGLIKKIAIWAKIKKNIHNCKRNISGLCRHLVFKAKVFTWQIRCKLLVKELLSEILFWLQVQSWKQVKDKEYLLWRNTCTRLWLTIYIRGLNKGLSSKFNVGSWVQETTAEGRISRNVGTMKTKVRIL